MNTDEEKTIQLVTFRVADEELAFPAKMVQEIIRHPTLTHLPKLPDFIDGMGNLRSQTLPIVNLRRLLGFAPKEQDEQTRVLVLQEKNQRIGFVVDGVTEVLTIDHHRLEPPPQTVAESSMISAIANLDSGKRLILILNENALMPKLHLEQESKLSTRKNVIKKGKRKQSDSVIFEPTANVDNEVPIVCFRVAQEEYAIHIMDVQEIIRLKGITFIPHAKAYIEGIINLRGHVIPVIDMRRRFGLDHSAPSEQSRIVVTSIKGQTTGLIVDGVSEVLRIPNSKIERPPESITEIEGRFIDGIGKLADGKRILLMVKIDALLQDIKAA